MWETDLGSSYLLPEPDQTSLTQALAQDSRVAWEPTTSGSGQELVREFPLQAVIFWTSLVSVPFGPEQTPENIINTCKVYKIVFKFNLSWPFINELPRGRFASEWQHSLRESSSATKHSDPISEPAKPYQHSNYIFT
jgi:hypothetical protein